MLLRQPRPTHPQLPAPDRCKAEPRRVRVGEGIKVEEVERRRPHFHMEAAFLLILQLTQTMDEEDERFFFSP